MKTNHRDAIRTFLDSQDRPAWSCEIVAATGCKPQHISSMVLDGSLVKSTEEFPHSYTVGIRPRARKTAEEVQAERRAYYAKRDALRKDRRRTSGKQVRTTKAEKVVKRAQIVLASSHATVGGESVAEFIARGGSIERLPGIQKSAVYTQRRPVMNTYRSISA